MTGKLPPMALDELAEQANNSPVAELREAARRVMDTRQEAFEARDELRDVATRCGIEIY